MDKLVGSLGWWFTLATTSWKGLSLGYNAHKSENHQPQLPTWTSLVECDSLLPKKMIYLKMHISGKGEVLICYDHDHGRGVGGDPVPGTYIYISCTLNPNLPLFWLEKALPWGVYLQKIEVLGISIHINLTDFLWSCRAWTWEPTPCLP